MGLEGEETEKSVGCCASQAKMAKLRCDVDVHKCASNKVESAGGQALDFSGEDDTKRNQRETRGKGRAGPVRSLVIVLPSARIGSIENGTERSDIALGCSERPKRVG